MKEFAKTLEEKIGQKVAYISCFNEFLDMVYMGPSPTHVIVGRTHKFKRHLAFGSELNDTIDMMPYVSPEDYHEALLQVMKMSLDRLRPREPHPKMAIILKEKEAVQYYRSQGVVVIDKSRQDVLLEQFVSFLKDLVPQRRKR